MREEEVKSELQTRIEAFNKELIALQQKYSLTLYAVNQIQENGEVYPQIKVKPFINFKQNADENQTKKRRAANKKARTNSPKK